MSAARNSCSINENGTAGSATFNRLTSPVRIIFVAIFHSRRSAAATIAVPAAKRLASSTFRPTGEGRCPFRELFLRGLSDGKIWIKIDPMRIIALDEALISSPVWPIRFDAASPAASRFLQDGSLEPNEPVDTIARGEPRNWLILCSHTRRASSLVSPIYSVP